MARRNKPSKLADLAGLLIVGGIVYWSYERALGTAGWVLLGVAVLMAWFSFAMPTRCDYRTLRNKPCSRRVRGKLRGCASHARDKRDALWHALWLPNPGRLFRVMWSAPADPPPAPVQGAAAGRTETVPSRQGARDATILVCTVLSTIAGGISATTGILALLG